jgi:hypothetical protein
VHRFGRIRHGLRCTLNGETARGWRATRGLGPGSARYDRVQRDTTGRKSLGTRLRGCDESLRGALVRARFPIRRICKGGFRSAAPAEPASLPSHPRSRVPFRRTREGGCPATRLVCSETQSGPVAPRARFTSECAAKVRATIALAKAAAYRRASPASKARRVVAATCKDWADLDSSSDEQECELPLQRSATGRKSLGTRLRGCDERLRGALVRARFPIRRICKRGFRSAAPAEPASVPSHPRRRVPFRRTREGGCPVTRLADLETGRNAPLRKADHRL